MIRGKVVTMRDVIDALERAPGEWFYASDLPCRGSIQGVSNALRHAWHRGLVERKVVNESANTSMWRSPA